MSRYDLGMHDHGLHPSSRDGMDHSRDLSWRLDPEESLSDWTIIIKSEQPLVSNNNNSCYRPPLSSSGGSGTSIDKINNNTIEQRKPTSRLKTPPPLLTPPPIPSPSINRKHPPTTTKIDTYHVHKTQLAVGKRHGKYFSRLFRNKNMVEAVNNTSEITLLHSAARAFPIMLDFMYACDGSDVAASSESAVGLRFLSNYFGVYELFRNINDFIQEDLTASNAAYYLSEAISFNDDKMITACLDLIAENFKTMDMKMLAVLPSELFMEVVCSSHLQCESGILSSRVVEFCRSRPDDVTINFLSTITSRDKMPYISPLSALFMLNLCLDMQHNDHDHDKDPDAQRLRDRCTDAIATRWKDVLIPSEKQKVKKTLVPPADYQRLPDKIKIELLESSLKKAKKEIDKKNAIIEEQAHVHNKTLEDLRKDTQQKITSLNKTANKYAFELSRFVRVPNSHTFGISDIRSSSHNLFVGCTYEEATASSSSNDNATSSSAGRSLRQFSQSGNRQGLTATYGKNPPTSMPLVVPPMVTGWSRDGWVFHEKRGQAFPFGGRGDMVDDHYWPVFYYKGY